MTPQEYARELLTLADAEIDARKQNCGTYAYADIEPEAIASLCRAVLAAGVARERLMSALAIAIPLLEDGWDENDDAATQDAGHAALDEVIAAWHAAPRDPCCCD